MFFNRTDLTDSRQLKGIFAKKKNSNIFSPYREETYYVSRCILEDADALRRCCSRLNIRRVSRLMYCQLVCTIFKGAAHSFSFLCANLIIHLDDRDYAAPR